MTPGATSSPSRTICGDLPSIASKANARSPWCCAAIVPLRRISTGALAMAVALRAAPNKWREAMDWVAVCGSVSICGDGRVDCGAVNDQKILAPSQAITASMMSAASLPIQGIREADESMADKGLTIIV